MNNQLPHNDVILCKTLLKSKSSQDLLAMHEEDLFDIFRLVSDPALHTASAAQLQGLLDQVSVHTYVDFERASKYFQPNSPFVPRTFQMQYSFIISQLSFDDFIAILKIYLDDNFDFEDKMSYKTAENIVLETSAIYKDFKNQGFVDLDEFEQLCRYFMKKAGDRKFVRYTKQTNFDFYYFLEQALQFQSSQFSSYMLFLKKNQKMVTVEDFIKILSRFDIITFPGGRDLDLNPSTSKLV